MHFDYNNITFLFTDVDDTLTTHGKLLPETYQALWRLHEAGIKIIPVTGGCAGWCDHIVRAWPVDAVIGEGGAFYLKKDDDGRIRRVFWGDYRQHQIDQQSILDTVSQLQNRYPVELAKDQAFRLVDVAIDYNQDCRITAEQLQSLIGALSQHPSFIVKKSSIHLNIVKGEFDKATMAKRLLTAVYGLTESEQRDKVVVIGDAPNDESLFRWFPNSFAVANIRPHLNKMTYLPANLTEQESGLGFVELIDTWLSQLKS